MLSLLTNLPFNLSLPDNINTMELQQEKKHKDNPFISAFDFFSTKKKVNVRWKKLALKMGLTFVAIQFVFAIINVHNYSNYMSNTAQQVAQVAKIFTDFKKSLDNNDSVNLQYDIIAANSKNSAIASSISSYMAVMAMNSDIPQKDKEHIQQYINNHIWDGFKTEAEQTQALRECNIIDSSCFIFNQYFKLPDFQKSYSTQIARNLFRMNHLDDYKKYQQELIDGNDSIFSKQYEQQEKAFIEDTLK
jgi:hypothetical protein